jgi:hypothetical protein
VDCGHSPGDLEIHPATALYWSHRFHPGIADFFFRASSYGWHPHIEQFTGGAHDPRVRPFQPAGSEGAFEADLDIPDADLMVPGTAPILGSIVADYAYSGYDVSRDASTLDGPYEINHPAAHLTGGDFKQPISTYFDISVTLNGSKVHVHALPNPTWDQTHDPARPALIGFHFTACVPVNDAAGKLVNGCTPTGVGLNSREFIGQAEPADYGKTLVGYFYDRFKPDESLTFDVRAFADTCDKGHTEAILGTVTTNPPDFKFSFPIPASITRICPRTSPGSPNLEPTDGIVLRHFAPPCGDRPEDRSTELFSYSLPGAGCVSTPETIATGGLCPAGYGFSGMGYFLCGSGTLVPFCQPGASGQPGVPGTPTGVTATGGANQITVAWQAVPMTAAYTVYSVSGTTFTNVATRLDTSRTFTGLANGVTQSYVVAGLNPDPAGEGSRSAVVTATTLHCSQNCAGCCNGETCTTASASTGCKINGQACGSACPAGTDTCNGGSCVCHQDTGTACTTTIGQADYMKTCGNVVNACGATVSCGTCPASPNWTCSSGLGAHCVCTPSTVSAACGSACNTTAPDGCGGTVTCPSCCVPLCGNGNCGAPDGCGGMCPDCCPGCVTP